MSTRRLALVVTMAIGLGCGGTDSGTGGAGGAAAGAGGSGGSANEGGSGGAPVNTCGEEPPLCDVDSDCCGGTCSPGEVGQIPAGRCCVADQAPCNDTSVCCEGSFCESGICQGAAATLADGLVCAVDEDCLSGNCSEDSICGPEGCFLIGDPCAAGADCCTGICAVDGSCSIVACLDDGATCADDTECCFGTCDASGVCAH